MKKLIDIISDFFYSGPVKKIPEGHRNCPACKGTVDYDFFIDCLYCEGIGYVNHKQAIKILKDLENNK